MDVLKNTSVRHLTPHEMAMVAGGDGPDELPEINVRGVRIHSSNQVNLTGGGDSYFLSMPASHFTNSSSFFGQLFGGGYSVTQDIPPPEDTAGEEEIVVEASKEQVAAAQQAYANAGFQLSVLQVVGAIVGGVLNKLGGAAVAGATEVIDINNDDLQGSYADFLYWEDGLDGAYDGYRGNYGYGYGWGFPYGGGESGSGPHTPPSFEPPPR